MHFLSIYLGDLPTQLITFRIVLLMYIEFYYAIIFDFICENYPRSTICDQKMKVMLSFFNN
jgi:hypothetical protein